MPPPLSGNSTSIPAARYVNVDGGEVTGGAGVAESGSATPELLVTALDLLVQELKQQEQQYLHGGDVATPSHVDSHGGQLIGLCNYVRSAIQPLLNGDNRDGAEVPKITVNFSGCPETLLNLVPDNVGQLLADLAAQKKIECLKLDDNVRPRWLNHQQFHVDYNKSRPYYSAKQDGRLPPDINFNGKTNFLGAEGATTNKVWCRHLALSIFQQWAGEKSAEPYANYASMDAIAQSHSRILELEYENFVTQKSDVYLVNHQIGKFFRAEFASMEASDIPQQSILMTTDNHAMTWQLKIKLRDDGSKDYVVKFYDPNSTATHQRVVLKSLDQAEKLEMQDFIASETYRVEIRMAQQQVAQMHKHAFQDQHGAQPASRGLKSYAGEPAVTGQALYQMLARNVPGGIVAFARSRDWPTDQPSAGGARELKELLAYKGAGGFTGLYAALHQGHTDAIKAYGDLLQHLPKEGKREALKELLAAKSQYGTPGLYKSMMGGHADAIKAFGDLLRRFSDVLTRDDLFELLAARDSYGLYAANDAREAGQSVAMEAYKEVVSASRLSKYQKAKLLSERFTFPELRFAGEYLKQLRRG